MSRRFLPLLATLSILSVAPHAQDSNETRIRSSQSSYWAYASGYGTVTGRPTDHVYIRNSRNAEVTAHRTIDGWRQAYRQGNPFVQDVVVHSGGEISIRFSYWCILATHSLLKGGNVSLYRGSTRIDVDELR